MGGSVLSVVSAIVGMVMVARILAPSDLSSVLSPSAVAEREFVARTVFWAFLLRASLSVVLHVTDWWMYLGGDEGSFDGTGKWICLGLQGELPFGFTSRMMSRDEKAYPYMIGAFYYTYGASKFIPLAINCALGSALVFPVHALAGRLGGRVAARRAAWLVAYFPSIVLWSTIMVRDVFVLLFLAATLMYAQRLLVRITVPTLIGLLFCCIAISLFRTYIFFVVAAAIVGALFLGGRSPGKALLAGSIVMAGLILVLRSGAIGETTIQSANLEALAVLRHNNALGSTGAGSLGTADISTPTAALTYLPLGLLYFYCSPLPWQIGSPRQVISLVDLLLWYSCLPSIVVGLAWLLRHRFRATLPLLFTVIGISVLYALVEGNIGIIFRHRAQIIVPLCAVAGVGYALKKRAQRKESRAREGPVPLHPADRGPFRPPEDLRLPARAP
jgi:hypothetical protein